MNPVWPSGKAGKQTDHGSIPIRFLHSLQKLRPVNTVFAPFPFTINEILKQLSSLSFLMQEPFWW